MAQQEPAIKWDTQKTSNSGDVAVTYTNNTSQPAVGAVGIAYWQSRTSTCFMIWDDPSNETVSYYANNITAATDCAAPTQAPSSSVPLWGGPSDTGAADGS
jgi:hypothetical protein